MPFVNSIQFIFRVRTNLFMYDDIKLKKTINTV